MSMTAIIITPKPTRTRGAVGGASV